MFRLPKLFLDTWPGQIEMEFNEEAFLVFRETVIIAHLCLYIDP